MSNEQGCHVCIDLETMGTKPNSAIVSIGAVKFDPWGTVGELKDPNDQEYKHFYTVIDLQSCLDAGLVVTGSTVDWWMKQPDETRKELTGSKMNLTQALSEFLIWYGHESKPTWGNGADFDCVILSNAYEQLDALPPFSYWDRRCYRTLKNLITIPYAKPKTPHHALEDAMAQAVHIQKMMNFINRGNS